MLADVLARPNDATMSTDAFLATASGLFIDGGWREGATPRAILDPSTGKGLLSLGDASARDVDQAVEAAQMALSRPDWARISAAGRGRLLSRLADLLERDAGFIAELEALNSGIPVSVMRNMALPLGANLLRYYAGCAMRTTGDVIPAAPGAAMGAETLTYTRREPVGVVAQIVPWNFPLGLALLKIAPALAAGCAVVLKPSELTPLSILHVAQLAIEGGIPAGVLNVVTGGAETGAALVSHPGVSRIGFTGSTRAGQAILGAAAGPVKNVALELGGKSPVIIFDDADLDLAVAGAAMAVFGLSGQNCMAGTRLFVHRNVHDRVVAGIEAIAGQLAIGPAIAPETTFGPLISERHRQSVMRFVERGIEQGATLVTGGHIPDGPGFFFPPTIFTGTTPDMDIVREEIFGPVLSVQTFDDDSVDDLAVKANDTPYGLSASIWTRDLSRAHRLAHRIQAGQVSVNCHGAVNVGIPFGGYKQSGWGREYGESAIDLYTETKAITVRL